MCSNLDNVLLNIEDNISVVAIFKQEAIGVSPGSQLRIASCGETVSLTLAYTALDNIMKHYIDFNAQRELDGKEISKLAKCNNFDFSSLNSHSIPRVRMNMYARAPYLQSLKKIPMHNIALCGSIWDSLCRYCNLCSS